jgi:hypothetical protein
VNIRGKENKLCINDNRAYLGLTQGDCDTNEALWKFVSIGGKYMIIAKSKNVIDVVKGKQENGAMIISMVRHNGYNQKWLIEFRQEGLISIKNFYSSKCIDTSGSKSKGSGYVQWDCQKGNDNQLFHIFDAELRLEELSKLTVSQKIAIKRYKVPSGWFSIVGNTGLCLTENGQGKDITQARCSNNDNNYWKFIKVENEIYTIFSKSGKALTNFQSKSKNGNPVISWDNQNMGNQKWQILPLPNGRILIRNPEVKNV